MKVKLSSLSVWQKVQLLRRELQRECLEREYHIDALIALFISKQHGLLLGPPGTGKSMLLELLCEAFSGSYFSMLVSENSKPDEFFGPVSIKGLQDQEIYKRNITGKLPQAQIAYLDEIFKTNSAALNQLLKLINERVFYNPDPVKVPLISLVGSSNELPQDDSLNAFTDRFVWKCWVGYMSQRDNIATVWQRTMNGHNSHINVRLSLSDFTEAIELSKSVDIACQYPILLTLKEKLAESGYQISDRKWLMILKFMQAFAWVRNESVVSLDIVKLLLPDCLWSQQGEVDAIRAKIAEIIDSLAEQVNQINTEVKSTLKKFKDTNLQSVGIDVWNAVAVEYITRLESQEQKLQQLQIGGAPSDICKTTSDLLADTISKIKYEVERVNSTDSDRQQQQIMDTINNLTAEARTSIYKWIDSASDKSLNDWNIASSVLAVMIRESIDKVKSFDVGTTDKTVIDAVQQAVNSLRKYLKQIATEVSDRNNLN